MGVITASLVYLLLRQILQMLTQLARTVLRGPGAAVHRGIPGKGSTPSVTRGRR
jgi:hypothetical protein